MAPFLAQVARDLLAHRGRAVVVAGEAQPPHVHALALAISASLGAFEDHGGGAAIEAHASPVLEAGAPSHDLDLLLDALDRGEIDALVVLGGNPAHALPRAVDFAGRMRRVAERIVLAPYEHETAAEATWLVPEAHPLETWGDGCALDGTRAIAQPTIAPLFGGRSAIEVLATFAGVRAPDGHALVREAARPAIAARDEGAFEDAWEQALARGVVGEAARPASVTPRLDALAGEVRAATAGPLADDALELAIDPDPRLHDGRFANLTWLLELPDPLTKLTWENALRVSSELAGRLGLATGDEVALRVNGNLAELPVVVVPGQARHALGLALGWGRTRGAPNASGRGADANLLRPRSPRGSFGLARAASVESLEKTGRSARLPITQPVTSDQGRPLVLTRALDGYREEPRFAEEHRKGRPTLYRLALAQDERQWAMTIDLTLCTGCSACVVACQAENDVPTVGREGVLLSREMHWLRIDRYVQQEGVQDGERARTRVQPMLCQHCEKAPCEYVCPVNATVHSPDGLNEQVYNRCVGTRFCSNNCPYKVRRFNWFDYHDGEAEPALLVHNPDVTVRARGVMEKCSFCVQRIRRAEIRSKVEERPELSGDVRTACQQVCPSRAIVFGDLSDPRAEVAALRENERAYAVLDELATEPRTRYLARIENRAPKGESR